eukprot:TRINITY_DN1482_c0_g1_i3.p1 TRINITY_DN1482_c0_g1~~TRINITY_DN1482_c0_g1_i3.p1  ORF type:complete len:451 (+),score=29.39 TRINITY_DN1482_c0_g1_i3:31-1383(+)
MDPEADLMDVETDPIVDLIPDDPNTPLTPSQARLLEIVSQHTDVDRFVANVAYFCKRHHSVRLAELEIRRDQDINKAKFVVALSAMISFFGPKPLSYCAFDQCWSLLRHLTNVFFVADADMVVSSRFPFSEVPMRYERAGAVFRKAVRKLKMYPEKGLFAGLESLSAIFEPDRPDTADRISRWFARRRSVCSNRPPTHEPSLAGETFSLKLRRASWSMQSPTSLFMSQTSLCSFPRSLRTPVSVCLTFLPPKLLLHEGKCRDLRVPRWKNCFDVCASSVFYSKITHTPVGRHLICPAEAFLASPNKDTVSLKVLYKATDKNSKMLPVDLWLAIELRKFRSGELDMDTVDARLCAIVRWTVSILGDLLSSKDGGMMIFPVDLSLIFLTQAPDSKYGPVSICAFSLRWRGPFFSLPFTYSLRAEYQLTRCYFALRDAPPHGVRSFVRHYGVF